MLCTNHLESLVSNFTVYSIFDGKSSDFDKTVGKKSIIIRSKLLFLTNLISISNITYTPTLLYRGIYCIAAFAYHVNFRAQRIVVVIYVQGKCQTLISSKNCAKFQEYWIVNL